MKPIYALTLCIGLLEGADAIVIPGSTAPNSGYALRPDDTKSTDDSKSAGSSKTNSNSIFPVFGKTNIKSSSLLVRRVVKTEKLDGSDNSPDAPSTTPSTTPWDTPSGPSDDNNEVYPEPFMQPTYVHSGPEPIDKPVAASKSKPSKSKSPKKKGSKGTAAKHGGDDNSSSGGHKQKSKGKDRGGDDSGHHSGDDDSTKSRSKTEDSPKTRSTKAPSTKTASRNTPTNTSSGDDSGKDRGKGKGKGGSGEHSGDDDDSKSRTRVDDSKTRATSSPSSGSGKHSGHDNDSKSRTKTEDSSKTRSSKTPTATPDSKKGGPGKHSGKTSSKKGSKHSRRAVSSVHQSGSTFDPDSTKGGGKNGPGYGQSFGTPKLNDGYIQAVPPKASSTNNKSSFKVKPKPSLDSKANKVRPIYTSLHKREKEILSLRAAAPFESVAIDRSKWTVTCDSFNQGNECKNAIDGNSDSFWHTQWEGSEPSPPHTITVDMKKSYNINGISMLPRQDGSPNGFIAQHQVFLSKDNKNWGSPVAYGTWYGDTTVKYANFDTQPARYVRLVAITEANGNPWTSIAELNVFQANDYVPFQSSMGAWGPTVNFPIIPVAGTVDPNTGKVLVWSSWARDTMDGGNGGETLTSTWDPATGLVTEREVNQTNHDMFCPGISLDGNGQLVVTGGNSADRTSLFDPVKQAWVPGPGMKVSRGYHASATTSTGKVFTIGGSWSGGDDYLKNGEVYDPKKKTWTLLANASVKNMLTNDAQGAFRSDNHAWLFGWKSGTVFQAGPSKNMNWYYTEKKNGDVKTAGQRGSDKGVAPDAMCGNAIMFDAVNGKILTNGGSPNYQDADATADAHIITLGDTGTNASTVYASNGLFYPRVFHSSVVLPNGNVFITGGQSYAIPFEDSTPQLQPEMYYPNGDYFEVMKANNIVRTYHSIALLLPDGRVFNGGGGLCGGCDTNHFDAQLYTPPYLYDSKGKLATRPKINSVSASTIKVGGTVTVQTGGAIVQASLIRYGTITHTVNSDQRRIPLTLSNAGKNKYSFQVPSDPGVALPGYWMLFVMDKNGVPSVASTIKVTGS